MNIFTVYLTKRKLFRIGMIISGVLALLIIIITYYGQNAGNFVMSIDEEAFLRGIVLSKDQEFLAPSPRLLVDPSVDVQDMTYDYIDLNGLKSANGDFNDPNFEFVGYTFYLKNIGEETVDVNVTIDILESHKEVNEAIRFLIIEDDTNQVIYKSPDKEQPESYNDSMFYPSWYPPEYPETVDFNSDTNITSNRIVGFRPEQVKKYSIAVWLEGYDPDCVEKILGGKLKMRMVFTLFDEVEE